LLFGFDDAGEDLLSFDSRIGFTELFSVNTVPIFEGAER
jgi:hypothetical protein